MTARSRNVLHAIRLVLNRETYSPVRHFSSLALSADSASSSSSFPSFSTSSLSNKARSRTAPSSSTAAATFLEEESALEYEDVRDELDDWYPMPSPHPWPTIFASNDPDKDRPTGLYCDALHNLVLRDDIAAAKSVLEEFNRLGYAPKPREVYLKPALACLYDTRHPDLEGFLSFLSLYPARTARTSADLHPEVWAPVVAHIKFHHTHDTDFMIRFMTLTSRLGLFPNIYKPISEHSMLLVSPSTSIQVFWDAVRSYGSWAAHAGTTVEAQTKRRRVVQAQVQERWVELVFALIRVGYTQEARLLLEQGQAQGCVWRGGEEVFESQATADHGEITPHDRSLPFARRIRHALTTRMTPNDLAALLSDHHTEFQARPALYERFRKSFRRPNLAINDLERPPAVRFRMWIQAELILLRSAGQHELAIKKFMSHHPWLGLPDHPYNKKKFPMAEPIYPNIHLITTILPSLAAVQSGRKDIKTFHESYLALAKDLPPILRPTNVTHAVWTQLSSLEGGTRGAFKALNRIYAAGMTPGDQAYLYVVLSLAHKGDLNSMETLLARLQSEAKHNGQKLPKLSEKDLVKVQEVLQKRLQREQRVAAKRPKRGGEGGRMAGTEVVGEREAVAPQA